MPRGWEIVVRLRPTIFVAALAFLTLSSPSQSQELYLIDIEEVIEWSRDASLFALVQGPARSVIIAAIFCLFVVFALWFSSLYLLSIGLKVEKRTFRTDLLANIIVVFISVAPVIGVMAGLINIAGELPHIVRNNHSELSELTAAVSASAWGTALLLLLAIGSLFASAIFRGAAMRRVGAYIFSRVGVVTGIAGILIAATMIAFFPITVPQALGTQAVVFLFFVALAFVLTFFSSTYRLTGCPVTVVVLGLGLVFALRGWNDNHRVEYNEGGKPIEMKEGFLHWYSTRGDLDHYVEAHQAYPVYVVAAEGGGIYAGYHVASFLARLQDTCPNFAQHVFAISSVSGGSLGAAQFAAMVDKTVRNGPWRACATRPADNGDFIDAARDFFSSDFLSPLVAAALFPDMLQRIIPIPINAFDRAHALEQAFIEAGARRWKTSAGGNPFEQSILKLWDASGATPALAFRATSIEMGSHVTLGSMNFGASPNTLDISDDLCPSSKGNAIDLPLATAVSLSARFSWVTPAGWLRKNEASRCSVPSPTGEGVNAAARDRLYLVDGGYYENSGLEAALEIATRLRALVRACMNPVRSTSIISYCSDFPSSPYGVEIRTILVFAKDKFADEAWQAAADLSRSSPGELYAPLKTLLNTSKSRARAVHFREWLWDDDLAQAHDDSPGRYHIPSVQYPYGVDRMHQVMIDGTKFFLPLGWQLSKRSMANIASNTDEMQEFAFELIRRELMGEDTFALKNRPNQ